MDNKFVDCRSGKFYAFWECFQAFKIYNFKLFKFLTLTSTQKESNCSCVLNAKITTPIAVVSTHTVCGYSINQMGVKAQSSLHSLCWDYYSNRLICKTGTLLQMSVLMHFIFWTNLNQYNGYYTKLWVTYSCHASNYSDVNESIQISVNSNQEWIHKWIMYDDIYSTCEKYHHQNHNVIIKT